MRIHHKPVISNTSPLIGLWGLDLFALFRDLYIEVWIPREVEKEFLSLEETVHREALDSAPWIKTIDLTDPESVSFYISFYNRHYADLIVLCCFIKRRGV